MSLADLLARAGRKIGVGRKPPATVVTHESIDTLAFRNLVDDSERFHKVAVDDAPKVAPVTKPEPLDPATATPDELAAYQTALRSYEQAIDKASPYSAWEQLTHDVFCAHHTWDSPKVREQVDPGVDLHRRLVQKLIATEEFAESRSITRGDSTTSAIATMATARALRDALGEELAEQARNAEEYRQHEQQAQGAVDQLEGLREQAKMHHDAGRQVPDRLKQQIQQAVADKRAAQQAAAAAAQQAVKPIDQAGADAIAAAAAAGAQAAEDAEKIPGVAQGLGGSDVTFQSPEEALAIADAWANNPRLKRVAELFGRLERDMRFQRSKRVVGGREEIVDVEFSDDLTRVVPSELALLADDDLELDFLARYAAGELLCFTTVGESHANRGPIVIVIDGSGSMGQERTAWARAVALALLNICRREKRDLCAIEFGSRGQMASWEFPAKAPVRAQHVMDLASHFFGGGTWPLIGMQYAERVIQAAPRFETADVVLVGDGEATFTNEDAAIKSRLEALGVRILGIGVGGSFNYLAQYAEHTVSVHDFELDGPSEATTAIATHLT